VPLPRETGGNVHPNIGRPVSWMNFGRGGFVTKMWQRYSVESEALAAILLCSPRSKVGSLWGKGSVWSQPAVATCFGAWESGRLLALAREAAIYFFFLIVLNFPTLYLLLLLLLRVLHEICLTHHQRIWSLAPDLHSAACHQPNKTLQGADLYLLCKILYYYES